MSLLLALLACTTTPPPEPPPAVWDLTAHQPELTLPAAAVPAELSAPLPLRGSPRRVSRQGELTTWAWRLPLNSDLWTGAEGEQRQPGSFQPPGVLLTGPDGAVPLAAEAAANTWTWNSHELHLTTPGVSPPSGYALTAPQLALAEGALHLQPGDDPFVFSRRRGGDEHAAFEGLLLPAPATASWELDVTVTHRFDAGVRLIPSHYAFARSDGATVRLVADTQAGEVELASVTVGPRSRGARLRASLGELGGGHVRLRVVVEPGASADYDHVMLTSPSVYQPDPSPRHVVLVFLDTTRADHLGTYGYRRDTTPTLDALAAEGAVFESARTIAPWTLPSVRAALSGAQPERWAEQQPLQTLLEADGFATMASFSNVFMTPAFGMDRDWDTRWFHTRNRAEDIVDHGLTFLDAHAERDALVLLQFMDAHKPYSEPEQYLGRWAPEPWEGPSIKTEALRRLPEDHPKIDEVREYVMGRYDQSLRYIDDQLARLLAQVRDDAIVVVWADHGEEFWDHGGFEHGHTFYDELLHVPLIVRAPGVPPGRLDTPVSLLDLAPTVLDLVDLPIPDGLDGDSLHSLMQGAPGAAETLQPRAHAFGRPLQGHDGWGVLIGSTKWSVRGNDELAFDLADDPEERTDISAKLDAAPLREALGEALGTAVVRAYKIVLSLPGYAEGLQLRVSRPEGFSDTWIAYAPRTPPPVPGPALEDGALVYTHPARARMPRAIYVVPKGDPADLTGLRLEVRLGDRVIDETLTDVLPQGALDNRRTLFSAGPRGFKVQVQPAWVPLPTGEEVGAYAPEATEALRMLGYLE